MNENAIGERVFYVMAIELTYPGILGRLLRFASAIAVR